MGWIQRKSSEKHVGGVASFVASDADVLIGERVVFSAGEDTGVTGSNRQYAPPQKMATPPGVAFHVAGFIFGVKFGIVRKTLRMIP